MVRNQALGSWFVLRAVEIVENQEPRGECGALGVQGRDDDDCGFGDRRQEIGGLVCVLGGGVSWG